jgi:hypothetical protein
VGFEYFLEIIGAFEGLDRGDFDLRGWIRYLRLISVVKNGIEGS